MKYSPLLILMLLFCLSQPDYCFAQRQKKKKRSSDTTSILHTARPLNTSPVFHLNSTAFGPKGMIPVRYTCKGQNISPPLSWSGIPKGTKTFAIIADDPDAPVGTWVHWVIYNIPSRFHDLPESVPPDSSFTDGTIQGKNSGKMYGYAGPCPPSGIHRYYFKIYALDTKLDVSPGATKEELLAAMNGHVLAHSELMGRFKK